MHRCILVEHMRPQSIGQFGLEPSRFWRHDLFGIGNCHQIFQAGREQREGDGHFAAVDPPFELGQAANAADEVDALIASGICNTQYGFEHFAGQQGDIKAGHRIGRGNSFGLKR